MNHDPSRALTIATMNIRHDADRWTERRPLLSGEFRRLRPDVIALQEVALGISQAAILQGDLNDNASESPYAAYVEPKFGDAPTEGIGCLTRLPVSRVTRIELPGGGGRVAQAAEVRAGNFAIHVVNTHLHNEPAGSEEIRAKQSAAIMAYIEAESAVSGPVKNWVLLGDFNAQPGSETVQRVLGGLRSAYRDVRGAEPPYTYPTPLAGDYADPASFQCIDYIFVSPSIRVLDIRLIFTEPHPDDFGLYPSDHFGLLATLELSSPISSKNIPAASRNME